MCHHADVGTSDVCIIMQDVGTSDVYHHADVGTSNLCVAVGASQ